MTDRRGEQLLRLVYVMDELRSPGGCPWDAQQTHQSLLEYLLEEAYETVEAVETGDRAALREELGDVLLQVVFHSRIAQEDEVAPFDIDDVAEGICEKLIRRHPHVFNAKAEEDSQVDGDLHVRWDKMKAAEKARTSVTEGVPAAMPSSLFAMKLLGRASRNEITSTVAPVSAAAETVAASAIETLSHDHLGDDLVTAVGEVMLAVIALASARGIDAEAALRSAVRGYRERILDAEASAREAAVG